MSRLAQPILPSDDVFQLTPLQEGMLYNHLSQTGSGVDIEQMVCTLHEELDVPCLWRAWQVVAGRHESLRSRFCWQGLDRPMQRFCEAVEVPIDEHDWREFSERKQNDRLTEYLAEDRRRGFDLTHASLFRLATFRLATAAFKFVWTFHHIILDGRSLPIILNELFTLGRLFISSSRTPWRITFPFRCGSQVRWTFACWGDVSTKFSAVMRY